jgi:actin-related protein
VLNVFYPVKKGLIQHWDHMIDLLKYMFGGLKVDLNGSSILLCESLVNLKEKKRKAMSIHV